MGKWGLGASRGPCPIWDSYLFRLNGFCKTGLSWEAVLGIWAWPGMCREVPGTHPLKVCLCGRVLWKLGSGAMGFLGWRGALCWPSSWRQA